MLHKHKQDIAPSADYWKGENTSISQFLKLFCFLTKTGFTISIFYSYFVKISVSIIFKKILILEVFLCAPNRA